MKSAKKATARTEGDVLKEGREAAELTQKDVSDGLGFTTPQFVSNAERGLCKFPAKHYKELSKLIGKKPVLEIIEIRTKNFKTKQMSALG